VAEQEIPEEPQSSSIPWTVGDVAKGVGVVICSTVLIAFGLVIGTLLLLGPATFLELGTEDVMGLFDLISSEGVLQQWLILMLVAMVVGEGAMPLSAWLFSAFKYRCGWRALGFRSFNVRKSLILAAVIVLVGLLISFLWDMLLTSLGMDPPSAVPPELTQTGLGLAIVAVLAVVVAPVAEETFLPWFCLCWDRETIWLCMGNCHKCHPLFDSTHATGSFTAHFCPWPSPGVALREDRLDMAVHLHPFRL